MVSVQHTTTISFTKLVRMSLRLPTAREADHAAPSLERWLPWVPALRALLLLLLLLTPCLPPHTHPRACSLQHPSPQSCFSLLGDAGEDGAAAAAAPGSGSWARRDDQLGWEQAGRDSCVPPAQPNAPRTRARGRSHRLLFPVPRLCLPPLPPSAVTPGCVRPRLEGPSAQGACAC